MRRALLPAVFTCLTVASPVFAQDWRVVGMAQGSTILLDNDSITHNAGDIQSIKMLLIYAETEKGGVAPEYAGAANVGLITFNCKLRLSKSHPLATYDEAGKVILGEDDDDSTEEWMEAEEGSSMFYAMQYACDAEKLDEHRFGPGIPIQQIRELMAANGF
jgi:hypothetical protein